MKTRFCAKECFFDPEDENEGVRKTRAQCWVASIMEVEPYPVLVQGKPETVIAHFNDKLILSDNSSMMRKSPLIKKV